MSNAHDPGPQLRPADMDLNALLEARERLWKAVEAWDAAFLAEPADRRSMTAAAREMRLQARLIETHSYDRSNHRSMIVP